MPIFESKLPIILASASPRRRELLSWLGLDFAIRPAPGESGAEAGEAPAAYASRAAQEKALAVLSLPEVARMAVRPLILAADTIVVLNGRIYGKPASHEQAWQFLRELSGNTHEVITGCCLLLPEPNEAGTKNAENAPYLSGHLGGTPGHSGPTPGQPSVKTSGQTLPAGYRALRFAPLSRVSMGKFPDQVLRAYAFSDEPMDKAGAYAVQGNGGFLIRSIAGSWSNVVGLPMSELTKVLLKQGVIHAAAP